METFTVPREVPHATRNGCRRTVPPSSRGLRGDLARRNMRGVDGAIGVGHPGGIAAGEMNAPECRGTGLHGTIGLRSIEQRIQIVGITVAPAVDGNGGKVAS